MVTLPRLALDRFFGRLGSVRHAKKYSGVRFRARAMVALLTGNGTVIGSGCIRGIVVAQQVADHAAARWPQRRRSHPATGPASRDDKPACASRSGTVA